jgi:hypothetical protein
VLEAEASPELRFFALFVVARASESEGARADALRYYRSAWDEPLGRAAVRAEAAAALVPARARDCAAGGAFVRAVKATLSIQDSI